MQAECGRRGRGAAPWEGSVLGVPTSLPVLGLHQGRPCQDPGAERGHQESQPHPGQGKGSARTPSLSLGPRGLGGSKPSAPRPPVPVLPAGPVRWLPPPAATAAVPQPQQRKVPNPGGRSSRRGPRGPPLPTSQRSPPPFPLDRNLTGVKPPTSYGLWESHGRGSLQTDADGEPPKAPPRVRGVGCFRENTVTGEVAAGG